VAQDGTATSENGLSRYGRGAGVRFDTEVLTPLPVGWADLAAFAASHPKVDCESRHRRLSTLTSELVASYLEAIGTVSAVILALFLQVYLVWKRRPRLSLAYSAGARDNDYRNVEKADFCEHWLQFRVMAKSGTVAARDVEVFVASVRRPDGSSIEAVPTGTLEWTDAGVGRVKIPSGTWRRVDLLCYWYGRHVDGDPVLAVVLHNPHGPIPPPMPPSRRHHLTDPGRYEIEFYISSDESQSTRWLMTFNHVVPTVSGANGTSSITAEALGTRIRDVRFSRLKLQ
jgi:hypothetical protein